MHLHLHAQGHDLGALEQTHHVFFRRADTPSPPSICMQSPTAAWQPAAGSRAASVCSMGVGWGGAGASVGSGSQLLEDVRRAVPGSCLAVSALRRSLAVYTDPANTPPAGADAVPGEGSAHPGTHLMLEIPSLCKVGALSPSKLLKTWVNKSAAPRWRCRFFLPLGQESNLRGRGSSWQLHFQYLCEF